MSCVEGDEQSGSHCELASEKLRWSGSGNRKERPDGGRRRESRIQDNDDDNDNNAIQTQEAGDGLGEKDTARRWFWGGGG